MKLWVTGATGQIGSEVVRLASLKGYEVLATGRHDLDITDQKAVTRFTDNNRPTVIINAAAYTSVDDAESNIESAYLVNAEAVNYLAQAALSIDVPLLHISTDYVFSGVKEGFYTETDQVCPINVYGASKRKGEEYLEKSGVKYLNLRTSWVFGINGRNFVKTMIRLAKTREELGVVYDQVGGPTFASDIARILLVMVEKVSDSEFKGWGTYNYSGSPQTTWWGLANYAIEGAFNAGKLKRKPLINRLTTPDFPTPALRPMNSSFSCSKIIEVFNVETSDWQKGVDSLIASID